MNTENTVKSLTETFNNMFGSRTNWDWGIISRHRYLSEDFIRENSHMINWNYASYYQPLSEDLIRELKDKVEWYDISKFQKLSESFMREFKDKVNFMLVSKYQRLSEDFIREFKSKVDWNYILTYQKLSKDFLLEFKNGLDWDWVSSYQYLPEDFRKKLNIETPKNCWLYKDIEFKRKYLKNVLDYKIEDDYVYAYKSTLSNGYSVYNFTYRYEVGGTYEANADYNICHENSFGLSAWTKEKALNYYSHGKLFLVKIHINDIAAIIHGNNKIRCTKLTIVEEIPLES